jgi:hypothetical protein
MNMQKKTLFSDNNAKIINWSETVLKEIKEGKIDDVVNKLPDKTNNEETPDLKGYLINNKGRMNYQEYKEKGYCIGSGAIESGNKKVIQQRLKQSGMHWSCQGGQSIAILRTKYCSNKWEEVEEFIYEIAA